MGFRETWVPEVNHEIHKGIQTAAKLLTELERHAALYTIPNATSRKVASSIPNNWHNHSGRNIALGLTQPLTELSTRNLPEGKWRPACRAENHTTTYDPIF
jgi:hypothetical protein